jgi:hypothetical protein
MSKLAFVFPRYFSKLLAYNLSRRPLHRIPSLLLFPFITLHYSHVDTPSRRQPPWSRQLLQHRSPFCCDFYGHSRRSSRPRRLGEAQEPGPTRERQWPTRREILSRHHTSYSRHDYLDGNGRVHLWLRHWTDLWILGDESVLGKIR